MAKKYPIRNLERAFYSVHNLDEFSKFATGYAGKHTRVYCDDSSACYSSQEDSSSYIIHLGYRFYEEAFNDTQSVEPDEVRAKYNVISNVLYGTFYHEFFHLMYTPFNYAFRLLGSCRGSFRQFASTVSNILEDITIEYTGVTRFPAAAPYIDAAAAAFLLPDRLEAMKESIENEPDNPGTMISFLLYYVRHNSCITGLPTYKMFEDHKDIIMGAVYLCINTIDGPTRIRRQVTFAKFLYKLFETGKEDQSCLDSLNRGDISSLMDDLNSSSMDTNSSSLSEGIMPILEKTSDITNDTCDVNNAKTLQSTEESVIKEPVSSMKAVSPDGSGSPDNPAVSTDLTKEAITMLANDIPVSRYQHTCVKFSKFYDTSDMSDVYKKIVTPLSEEISRLVSIIRKLKATNTPGWEHYKMSGKFDISTVHKKGNYKFFKKPYLALPERNSVYALVIDISGSMLGSKARIAGTALIEMCESLNRLHIPFSVDAFTEADYCAITISLKGFTEPYEKIKNDLLLITEQFSVRGIYPWCGNVDEVNLRFIGEKLMTRPEEDKFLIVLSDGATCGSEKSLKLVANYLERSGITVLGIGLYDDNVENIYKNHIVLKTEQDLKSLGGFLQKYLIGKVFK